MPTTFEPIMGSSFDAIASQRQFWAQHSKAVEEANLARQAQAQAQINAQAMAVSQAQRADAGNAYQIGADRAARAMQAMQVADQAKRHDYEFGVNAGLSREQIAATKSNRQAAVDERTAAEKKALDVLDTTAEYMSPAISEATKKLSTVRTELAAAEDKMLKEAESQKAGLDPALSAKLVIARDGTLVPNKGFMLTPEESTVVGKANIALTDAKANYAAVAATHDNIQQNVNFLLSRVPKDLNVDPSTGEIQNPFSKRRFPASSAASLAPVAAPVIGPDQAGPFRSNQPAPAPALNPVPATPALIVGKTYRGKDNQLGTWTGTEFMPVSSPANSVQPVAASAGETQAQAPGVDYSALLNINSNQFVPKPLLRSSGGRIEKQFNPMAAMAPVQDVVGRLQELRQILRDPPRDARGYLIYTGKELEALKDEFNALSQQ